MPPATRKAQGRFLWEGDAPALTVHGDLTSSREGHVLWEGAGRGGAPGSGEGGGRHAC